MANLPGRYKFLTDLFAAFTAKQYSGLPGIIQDKAYKLAWYAGGLWRWAAPGDADGNVKATAVYVSDTERISALGKVFATDVEISSMTSGKYALAGADGLLGNGALSEDATSVKSAKPLTLNGATRPAWALWDAPIQLSNLAAIYTITGSGGQVGFARNFYVSSLGERIAIVSGTGIAYPSQFHVDDNGRLRFYASQTNPVAGSPVTDMGLRFEVNRFGAILCRESEFVASGIAASIATPSPYTNSTTPTSMIAAGAKTIPSGRWGTAGTIWTALFMGTIQWTNTHTIRFEVLLGATVIADSGAVALSALASGSFWSLTLYGTIRTIGASGTMQIDGVFRCTEAGGFVAVKGTKIGTGSPAAIDTTVANTFNVRVTAGTASAANIFTTRTFHFSGN